MRMSVLEYSEELTKWNPNDRNHHRCQFCKFLSTSPLCIINHAKRHQSGLEPFDCRTNNVENYFCRNCNFTVGIATKFRDHISEFQGKFQSEVGFKAVTKNYICEKCDFQTYSILNLFKHVFDCCLSDSLRMSKIGSPASNECETRRNEWKKCQGCPYKTKHAWQLQHHVITTHLAHETRWYKCSKCYYKTNHMVYLKQHILNHSVEYEYSCDRCPYRTHHKDKLERHKLTVHTIQLHKCDKCPYRSKRMCKLEEHVLTAHEGRWYKCAHCNYKTRDGVRLKLHDVARHFKEQGRSKSDRGVVKFKMQELKYHLDHNYCKYFNHLQDHEYCREK